MQQVNVEPQVPGVGLDTKPVVLPENEEPRPYELPSPVPVIERSELP